MHGGLLLASGLQNKLKIFINPLRTRVHKGIELSACTQGISSITEL
jgi:hypothetical protein